MEERMKYLKMFGLAALAAALMAFIVAGSASATTLTGAGGTALGAGTVITSEAEGMTILHPPFGDIECEESKVGGKTTNAGSSTETVLGNLEALSFSKCNATVTVLQLGSLEIHTQNATANNNGTLTSSGTEVTVEFFGTHCIFKTSNTDIGTVTGSANTGGNATFDISATIPRTGGRSGPFCGSTAQWTGSYKITSPSTLNVD
jgi:hypothetical protein